MRYLLTALLLLAFSAFAQQEGKRVYQKDSLGNNLYHLQSWVIKDGKLCPVDTVGNRQHHKPCLEIGSKEMDKALKGRK
jgi:hypothetical protein